MNYQEMEPGGKTFHENQAFNNSSKLSYLQNGPYAKKKAIAMVAATMTPGGL